MSAWKQHTPLALVGTAQPHLRFEERVRRGLGSRVTGRHSPAYPLSDLGQSQITKISWPHPVTAKSCWGPELQRLITSRASKVLAVPCTCPSPSFEGHRQQNRTPLPWRPNPLLVPRIYNQPLPWILMTASERQHLHPPSLLIYSLFFSVLFFSDLFYWIFAILPGSGLKDSCPATLEPGHQS